MALAFTQYEISCPAKINHVLKVGGVQSNGYHPVETLVQKLKWGDHLRIGLRQSSSLKINLKCSDRNLKMDNNLVVKAAQRFSEEFLIYFEMQAYLKKRIPMQAGLGGGSSDAVAALKVLAQWAQKELKRKISWGKLHTIAASLGSDLNLFLEESDYVWCRGRGEITQPVSTMPTWPLVLVFPKSKVETAWAYREFDQKAKPSKLNGRLPKWVQKVQVDDIPLLQNDFQNFVMSAKPELMRLYRDLQFSGAMNAQMTGSGSCFFGVFFNISQAQAAQKYLKSRGWQTQLISS